MKRNPLIIVPLFLTIFLAGCNFSLAADVTPPPGYQPPVQVPSAVEATSEPVYPLVPPDPAQGEVIFLEKCAGCHGEKGLGDGPQASEMPNPVAALASVDVGRQAVPSDWFELVTKGDLERFMPPFRSLTNKQRWDVVAYAMSLSASMQTIEEGKALFNSGCSGCHGADGKGIGPMSAGLDVKPADFTDQQQMAEKSQMDYFIAIKNGMGSAMPAFDVEYSDDQRWALAAYIRSLSFLPVEISQPLTESAGTPAAPTAGATKGVESPGTTQVTKPVAQATAKPRNTATPTVIPISLGSITGSVIYGSDTHPKENLEVVLHGFDQMSVVLTQTTTLAADGTFAFDNVEMTEGRIFLATVDYSGITYGSDVATATGEVENFEMPIEIFDTSTDTSLLSVDRLHFFFDFLDEQTLQVVELYVISNPSQKTIVSAIQDGPVLSFSLPDEALNLQFQDGELGGRFFPTDGGFSDSQPVRPGVANYQVLFTYELPYSKKVVLDRKMQLNTNAVVILLPAAGLEIKGDTLQDAGTRDVQGTQYRMYNASSLKAGENIELTITGKFIGENLNNTSSILIGIGALGLALLVAGVWLFQRNKARQKTEEEELEPEPPVQQPAETIMDAILTLDDLYRAGELPEDAYLQRRKELKERLRQVISN